jgi:tRNA modification GTPase
MHDLDVTIVAVATPPGRGGVGSIRISGPDAAVIASRMFERAGGKSRPDRGRLRFGRFLDRRGSPVDHGYLVRFDPESSFTGESTVELWPHGSPVILAELVETAVAHGARPAGPGEFTYRALSNGRLDLARSEAVRDLVAARTLYQAKVAYSQAEGSLSIRLAPLRESLEEWIARGEAALEFVEDSETHLPPGELGRGIAEAKSECERMLDGFCTGRVIREGATLAIIGLPNVGKSSLFNQLLVRDRAIVAEMPGTTRDTLEEELDLDGIPVRLVDTAGLRDVSDPVEWEGVRRARRAREEADQVLLVLDGSRDPEPREIGALDELAGSEEAGKVLVVVNKCDLEASRGRGLPHPGALRVSAKTGEGVGKLRKAMREHLLGPAAGFEDTIVTNARHAEALRRTLCSLEKAGEAVESGLSEELVLEDLREARRNLGRITGEFTTEDLYDRIFSTFCIGK